MRTTRRRAYHYMQAAAVALCREFRSNFLLIGRCLLAYIYTQSGCAQLGLSRCGSGSSEQERKGEYIYVRICSLFTRREKRDIRNVREAFSALERKSCCCCYTAAEGAAGF